MARPKKQRIIEVKPKSSVFRPDEIELKDLEVLELGLDELEALRLTNLESLSQEETAEKMGISRQLVGLLLSNAKKKITDALINSKALKISSNNSHHLK